MISTGYFPYAQYVRDYNPPPPLLPGQESPMYSTISNATLPNRQSSLLNVTDPRYSATYGNHLLRQVGEHFVLMFLHSVEITKIYSHDFLKNNFVKATYLLKKLI